MSATRVEDALDALLAEVDPRDCGTQDFLGRRFDHGLAFVDFPEGLGGLGVSRQLQAVVDERLKSAGAPSMDRRQFFMNLAAPTILTHGTQEQKERYLRPMFTGEEWWCQLFSEPGAGSDLAGLSTHAVREGGEWVLTGQKVWNTRAHIAHWGMLLARTDPNEPKHRGLTYFLLDMRTPGVEIRPLRQITGEAEFNEVFLTDVRISDKYRLGAVSNGWSVALTTLMNERTSLSGTSGTSRSRRGPIGEAVRLWHALPPDERDPVRRDHLMRLWTQAETLRLTNLRAAAARRSGNPGPEGSIAKLALADQNKAIYDLCLDLLGATGTIDFDYTFRVSDPLDRSWGDVRRAFLRVRANSIEGGTSEIMRNIIGENVLGLPREPRPDKEIAWSQVPRS